MRRFLGAGGWDVGRGLALAQLLSRVNSALHQHRKKADLRPTDRPGTLACVVHLASSHRFWHAPQGAYSAAGGVVRDTLDELYI